MTKSRKVRRKKKLGSIPFTGIFFSMTLALLILGTFGLLVLLAKNLTTEIRQHIEIQVFLQKNVSENDIITIRSTLAEMDFVAKKANVPQITFVSKAAAAASFSAEIGEDFVRYIGENPLLDLFIIQVDEDYQHPEQLRSIQSKIESLRGVLEAAYVEQLVESIHRNLTKLSMLLIGLTCLLFIAVIIIMNHAVRLALFSQRFLIRSMQLVGATSAFIKRPFLWCATIYGFLAAAGACLGIYGLLIVASNHIAYLDILVYRTSLILLFAGIFVVGIFTSYFSTRGAITRYLRMSLDDLY